MSGKTYKCPFCDARHYRENLAQHIEEEHEEMIPEGMTPNQLTFNIVNNKDHGTCVVCKRPTKWNEKACKYDRLCGRKECREALREAYKKNMIKVYGKTTLLDDPNHQEKMLANRKISGTYRFSDGGRHVYTGSYEKNCLEFLDKVMGYRSTDILSPGPILEYEYKGQKLHWITDILLIPYNLIIEVKDGGSNPNNREMTSYREKQISKEQMITNLGKYSYIRLTNNDFSQLLSIVAELKAQYIDDSNDNKKVVIRIHEAVEEISEATRFLSNLSEKEFYEAQLKFMFRWRSHDKENNVFEVPKYNKEGIICIIDPYEEIEGSGPESNWQEVDDYLFEIVKPKLAVIQKYSYFIRKHDLKFWIHAVKKDPVTEGSSVHEQLPRQMTEEEFKDAQKILIDRYTKVSQEGIPIKAIEYNDEGKIAMMDYTAAGDSGPEFNELRYDMFFHNILFPDITGKYVFHTLNDEKIWIYAGLNSKPLGESEQADWDSEIDFPDLPEPEMVINEIYDLAAMHEAVDKKYTRQYKDFEEFSKYIKTPMELNYWYFANKIRWFTDKEYDKRADQRMQPEGHAVVVAWPDEIIKNKIGICYDHAIFMHYLCKKSHIKHGIIHIGTGIQLKISTTMTWLGHAVTAYEDNNQWFIFNYQTNLGSILGPYPSLDAACKAYKTWYEGMIKTHILKQGFATRAITDVEKTRYFILMDDSEEMKVLDQFYNDPLVTQTDILRRQPSAVKWISSFPKERVLWIDEFIHKLNPLKYIKSLFEGVEYVDEPIDEATVYSMNLSKDKIKKSLSHNRAFAKWASDHRNEDRTKMLDKIANKAMSYISKYRNSWIRNHVSEKVALSMITAAALASAGIAIAPMGMAAIGFATDNVVSTHYNEGLGVVLMNLLGQGTDNFPMWFDPSQKFYQKICKEVVEYIRKNKRYDLLVLYDDKTYDRERDEMCYLVCQYCQHQYTTGEGFIEDMKEKATTFTGVIHVAGASMGKRVLWLTFMIVFSEDYIKRIFYICYDNQTDDVGMIPVSIPDAKLYRDMIEIQDSMKFLAGLTPVQESSVSEDDLKSGLVKFLKSLPETKSFDSKKWNKISNIADDLISKAKNAGILSKKDSMDLIKSIAFIVIMWEALPYAFLASIFATVLSIPIETIGLIFDKIQNRRNDKQNRPNLIPIKVKKIDKDKRFVCVNTHGINLAFGAIEFGGIFGVIGQFTKITGSFLKDFMLGIGLVGVIGLEQIFARDFVACKRDLSEFVDHSDNTEADVLATNDGVVIYTTESSIFSSGGAFRALVNMLKPAGNCIAIRHSFGAYSLYGHLKEGSMKVHLGEKVAAGQKIAEMGDSGNSTAPHLHFEMCYTSPIGFTAIGMPLTKFKTFNGIDLDEFIYDWDEQKMSDKVNSKPGPISGSIPSICIIE